ncbi:MAG: hypothetical protein IME94_01615 [Proteobacteria bacterium]|nr:hypothetical protein [Pseudomonadota bacterium]
MMKHNIQIKNLIQRQQGAVLFISLIMLLLLTIIGVSSMKGTLMEEKMAGNLRDHTLAFEAAESALRDAEKVLEGIVSRTAFNINTNGLYDSEQNMTDILTNSTTWETDASLEGNTIPGIATTPRYVIQHRFHNEGSNPDSSEMAQESEDPPTNEASDYAVVYARGTGATDNSVVMIQTFYGMKL